MAEKGGTLRKVPVIVISAVASGKDVEEIKNIGEKNGSFMEYLKKPADLKKIEETTKKALQST